MKHRALAVALTLGALCLPGRLHAQARDYAVRLTSASVYDTASGKRDTVYAALTIFVNGTSRGTSIWDGHGWDGSRTEGRDWDTGLHIFGTSTGSTVRVSTGPVQDGDTIQIVLNVVNAAMPPTDENYRSAADRIRKSSCTGGGGSSAWDCLVMQSDLLAGWSLGNCEGLVAADKLVYTGLELRMKTETGGNIDLGKFYQRSSAPAGCASNSIYGTNIGIASQ